VKLCNIEELNLYKAAKVSFLTDVSAQPQQRRTMTMIPPTRKKTEMPTKPRPTFRSVSLLKEKKKE
jgi:hypothetical protein